MLENDHHLRLGVLADRSVAFLRLGDRRRHTYAIGKTGTGKTTLLANLLHQDIEAGVGLCLLDPHGDLAVSIADRIPAWRRPDVIYFDPNDLAHPFAYNPLHNVPVDRRSLVAAQVVETFAHIWGTSLENAPRMTYILINSLRLLLDAPGSTLLGLPRLLAHDDYRERLLAHCRDPVVRAFWTDEFAKFRERYALEAIAPIQNKVGTLLSPPAIRNILGQVKSTIDIRGIMDKGQVLIVNLSKGQLGETPTHLIGALLTTAFSQAAVSRADTPEDERRDFTLYADEFQHFATNSFATILSEARKYRLSLVLAHQFLGQLPDLLRQAVIGNAGTIVCFRIGAEDAPLLADELGIDNRSALTDLSNYTAWCKLMTEGTPLEPHVLFADPPHKGRRGSLEPIRRRSQARHGRHAADVEAKIGRFLTDRPR